MLQTGYNKPISQLTTAHKDEVVSALIDFHLMAKMKGFMDQFIDGLKVLGMLEKIKQQPSIWEPLFVQSSTPQLTQGVIFHV